MRLNPGYVVVTEDLVQSIKDEIERTDIRPIRALKGHKEAKKAGLNSTMIYKVINSDGRSVSIREAHREILLNLWKRFPNKQPKQPPKPKPPPKKVKERKDPRLEGLEPITEEFLATLKREEERTGIKAQSVADDPYVVANWKAGAAKSACPEKQNQILGKMSKLPDKD